jgi:hypothetical protein
MFVVQLAHQAVDNEGRSNDTGEARPNMPRARYILAENGNAQGESHSP